MLASARVDVQIGQMTVLDHLMMPILRTLQGAMTER
jgi:hypothetical protein